MGGLVLLPRTGRTKFGDLVPMRDHNSPFYRAAGVLEGRRPQPYLRRGVGLTPRARSTSGIGSRDLLHTMDAVLRGIRSRIGCPLAGQASQPAGTARGAAIADEIARLLSPEHKRPSARVGDLLCWNPSHKGLQAVDDGAREFSYCRSSGRCP